MRHLTTAFVFLACTLPLAAQDVEADVDPKGALLMKQGDSHFKQGDYLKASENYRLALLKDPQDARKKLAFGKALFAIGNYSYASYAIRRGLADLEATDALPEIQGEFPTQKAYSQALRDLHRYVNHSPRDAAGLSVLAYVRLLDAGERDGARKLCDQLLRLEATDPFALQVIARLERKPKPKPEPEPQVEPEPQPEPHVEPQPMPQPEPAPAPAKDRPLVVDVTEDSIQIDGMGVDEEDLPTVFRAALTQRGDALRIKLVGHPGADARVVRVLQKLTAAGIDRIAFEKGAGR